MLVTLSWHDIALRLALTFVTAALIGFDCGEHGRAAGTRTTLLLSLAACVAMLRTVKCELPWRPDRSGKKTPAFIEQRARRAGVKELEWKSCSVRPSASSTDHQ